LFRIQKFGFRISDFTLYPHLIPFPSKERRKAVELKAIAPSSKQE
jgi:hypothetical protein